MVAITVILAAVIGAFVLEIGDQQETAPSTSFDTQQSMQYYSDGGDAANLTRVRISHAGGTTLSVSQNNIKVNGNGSVWGVSSRNSGATDSARPQPNLLEALGSNDKVTFSSGERWDAIAYNNEAGVSDANLENIDYRFDYATGDDGVWLNEDTSSGGSNAAGWGPGNQLTILENGDSVNVVWTASSGGKTQSLQRYTVQ